MKILVINNSAISVDDNGFYTDAFNGNFVSELQKIGNDVSFLHFRANKKSEFTSFNLKKAGIDVILMKSYRNKLLKYFFVARELGRELYVVIKLCYCRTSLLGCFVII